MNTILIDFSNLENEVKQKEVELLHGENLSMFIKDKSNNIYEAEKYFVGSYLDGLQSNKAKVSFHKILSKNIEAVENLRMKKLIG
ncbi:hypothetical protein JOC34_000489 [Virgibacillus halotolerans]|uniref:hypothetical protein n=1 Tax=Virgibacillus halotolerans TaxID=1071053 RepID=UPI001961EE4B|nr:hypothetical protein [Virgibacillus halotolerans]MBM7598132.1 hypothetical protein [Virgibacillus halotolerans]